MPDGSFPLSKLPGTLGVEPRVRDCLGSDRTLLAQCPTCGRSAPCDPGPWIAEGLANTRLSALTTRLRCVCGGRAAILDVFPGPVALKNSRDLYVFR